MCSKFLPSAEERGLSHFVTDATDGRLIVPLVDLEADIVAMFLGAGHSRCAAADEGVENYPPRSVLFTTRLRTIWSGFTVGCL